MRCPGCRHQVTLTAPYGEDHGARDPGSPEVVVFGDRVCPNPDCLAHVSVVWSLNSGQLLDSYPAERLDFDPAGVPQSVVEAFEEAITCHADQCYVASAVMVRKTIEAICRDQNAKGGNLFERIENLATIVTLPKAFLDGLHDLRLLGNDAAHIDAQIYQDVGPQEVEAGIAVAKEFLRSVYQYEAVMDQLAALKRSQAGDTT